MSLKRTLQFSVAVVALILNTAVLFADGERTWTGKWNNRKFGTNGPLKCVATESKPGQWDAVFTGTFQGDPFEYSAQFQSKAGRNELTLGGTATIRGHQYEWTGTLRGDQLLGKYRSTVGYFGEFQLEESGVTPAPAPQTASPAASSTVESTPAAVIIDGERMLFIGNSYMANEGGVFNYLKKALQVAKGPSITTEQQISYGKPLRSMLTTEVRQAILSDKYDSVVITSDRLGVMKRFDEGIRRSGKKTIVFMTWEGQHPGNRATEAAYTAATQRSVEEMRRMEAETGATIIPAAVVYHDLTINPPAEMPRVDYLWRKENIHQNELGTMVNTWMFYAMLTGKSPVGVDFDMPPHIVGDKLEKDPEIRLTPELRKALQERVWQVAQAWTAGTTQLR